MSEQTVPEVTVEDRAEIEDLYARYAWALDRGDDDAFAATFTLESVFEDPSGRYAGRNAPYEVMAAMRANTTFPGRQHWIGQIVLEPDGDQIRSRAFVMVTSRHASGATNLHLVAAYFDRLRRADGRWRIAERIAKPWRGELLEAFPEIRNQPDWSRRQQGGGRS